LRPRLVTQRHEHLTRTGKEGAHEKGGVEGDVGRWRRTYLVPVPEVSSLAELNDRIGGFLIDDLRRTIRGRGETVGEALGQEVELLRPLPSESFDTFEHARPRVDAKALVTVRQNQYSVPVALAGLRVAARIGARQISLWHDGREVARHERLHGKYATSAQLDHYLELLALKPGALARSLPLRQARERGGWPDVFDRLWRGIEGKVGASEAARQMVDVLLLCRELGPERVELAARGARNEWLLHDRARQMLVRVRMFNGPGVVDAQDGQHRPVPGRGHRSARRRGQTPRARAAAGGRGRRAPNVESELLDERGHVVSTPKTQALEALIEAHATELKLPTVKRRFPQLAAEALREQQTPIAYLAALLEAEHQERAERRERRRLIDARFPIIKRL
jgi:hypothetical protein